MRQYGFLLYLIGLSLLGFLATDMYLPAFSAMQQSLQLSAAAISASLSSYLAGFTLTQLLWGALSDRLGRRWVVLSGLTLFAVGCGGLLVTEQALGLWIWRFVQAVGACAATVSWQTLVIDRYPKPKATRIFATIMPLVALSPALAPLIGAWLLTRFGWRSIFALLLVYALVLLASSWRLAAAPAASSSAVTATGGFAQMLRSRRYQGNVTIYASCSAAFFAWLTGSPFILSAMGYAPQSIGLSYLPQTAAFLLGGFGCRALLNRYAAARLLPVLIGGFVCSVAALLLLAMNASVTLPALLIPFSMMALMNGAIYPIVVSQALLPFPQLAGKASALQNTCQLGLCFVISSLVSLFIARPLLATTAMMGCCALLALWGYRRQRTR